MTPEKIQELTAHVLDAHRCLHELQQHPARSTVLGLIDGCLALLKERDELTLRCAELEERMITLALRRVEVEAHAENLTTALQNVETLADRLENLTPDISLYIREAAKVPTQGDQ